MDKLFVANLTDEGEGGVDAYFNERIAVIWGFNHPEKILDRRDVLGLLLLRLFALTFCSEELISRKECQI